MQLHRTARENPGKASQTFPSNKMIDGKPILFSGWIKKSITRGFSSEINQTFAANTRFFFPVKKLKTAWKTSQMQQTMWLWAPRCVGFCLKFVFDHKSVFFHIFLTELTELSASFQCKEKVKHGRTKKKRHRKAKLKRPQRLKKEYDSWHVYGTWSWFQSWQTQAKEKCRLAICSSDDGRNS